MKEKFSKFIKKHNKLLTVILSVIFGVVVLASAFLLINVLDRKNNSLSASADISYTSDFSVIYRPPVSIEFSSFSIDCRGYIYCVDLDGTNYRRIEFSSFSFYSDYIHVASSPVIRADCSFPILIIFSSTLPSSPEKDLIRSAGFVPLFDPVSFGLDVTFEPSSVSSVSSDGVTFSDGAQYQFVFPYNALISFSAYSFIYSNSSSLFFPFSNLTNYSFVEGETCYFLTVYYSSSSQIFYYGTFNAPAIATQLSAPEPYLLGNQIRWNAVPNAVSYDIYRDGSLVTNIDNDGSSVFIYSPTVSGSYTVIAKGNGTDYSDSDSSDPVLFTASLPAPVLSITYNQLSWTSVPNATSYSLYRGDDFVSSFGSSASTALISSSGSYTVVASADGYNSSTSNAISYTVPDVDFVGVWQLNNFSDPSIDGGVIDCPFAYSLNSNGSGGSWFAIDDYPIYFTSKFSRGLWSYIPSGELILLNSSTRNANYLSIQSEPSVTANSLLFWYTFHEIATKVSSTPWDFSLYDEGYSNGYHNGYHNGYDSGASQGLTNPLLFFITPIDSFLSTNLFGSVSIGDIISVVLFVFVALIFLKMFAGG